MTQDKFIHEIRSLVRKWQTIDAGSREMASASFKTIERVNELLTSYEKRLTANDLSL